MYQDIDPIWQKFVQSPAPDFKLQFDPKDPAIDQDPFFLRSQRWSEVSVQSNNYTYRKVAQGLEITVPDTKKSLVVNVPLNPIQATEDFLFFSIDKSSDLFQKAKGSDTLAGEGVFFINRAEISGSSAENRPVPLYFFPLSGQGWTGQLSSLQIPQSEMIVISNSEESVAIELVDVETIMKAQQINLVMANAVTARNQGFIDKNLLPAPGMTAAFGMFFTGIDLLRPQKSMWPQSSYSQNEIQNKWFNPLLRKFSNLAPLMMGTARAAVLPPELISRLVFVGSILTGMLVASVAIKYAHPGVRKKIQSLRANQDPIRNPIKLVGREIKETFDVFAAITATSAQLSSVTFANALELFLDRFMPTLASSEHGLIRRFLQNTFYFSRNSMRNVPVNSRTFVLGALVMGSVDTAMVAVQYHVAVPMIAQAVSPHVGESMQNRINETFDPNNPNTKQIALQDTVRNGIAYIQTGASSYSMEARAQVIEAVTKDVENEMKTRGLDPADPKNQTEKQNRIEEKINITMKQKGLPDQSFFLFDANTAFSKIPKALGYDKPEDMQAKESFVLQSRFGLSHNALSKAIQVATEWVKNDSSTTSREALALLEETERSMSFLKNGLKHGKEGLLRAREIRQQLTILSYEGSVEYAVKYIPEAWSKKYSPAAAQVASLIFRQALYSYLSSEGDSLLFANDKNVEKFGDEAKKLALEDLKKSRPEITNWETLDSELSFELKLRTQIEINNLARAEASRIKADKYTPPKQDWMTRRKQKKALAETELAMQSYLKTAQGQNATEKDLADKKSIYFRNSLARQIGLHIEDPEVAAAQGREDYVKMLNYAEAKAVETTTSETTSNPEIARYLEKLSPIEKSKMQLFMYANNFFQSYKEATTELEMVKPTDPAQPGRFQRLRQTEIVRNSQFLTRTLRAFESFGDDQSMKLSLMGSLSRSVPLFSDLLSTHKRTMKTILPALSVSYLWSYYAWQVHMPFSAWMLLVVTAAATISTPSQWLNRGFRLNGLKAMDSVISKVAYSIPYAWVTFAGMFPIMLFSGDVSVFFSDYIRTPIMSVIGQVELKDWLIGALGLGLITSKLKGSKKPDYSENAKNVNELVKPIRTGSALKCSALFGG